jgi:hypothetical protein
MLFGRSIRLQQENFFDNLLVAGLFCSEVPLAVVGSHSEASRQK